jgi:hypothetical protein
VTAPSSPIAAPAATRPWTPVVCVVAAALAIGGIAGAASLADDDGYSAGPGGRLSVQHPENR